MCQRPFVEREWDHATHAALSLYIAVGPGMTCWTNSSSSRMFQRCCKNLVHSSVSYISASAVLRAVMVWRFETQWIGLCRQMINPESDRVLKSLSGLSVGFGFD